MSLIVVASAVLVIAGAACRGLWSPCGLSMISQITPVSERARGHRFWVTALWFLFGAMAGGATVGAGMATGAWLVGIVHLSDSVRLSVLTLGALITIASDSKVFGFALPFHPRQVNETWLRSFRPWAYAAGFGWQIGTGIATYIMTSAVYLVFAIGVLSASPTVAFATGIGFGAIRGTQIFLTSRTTTPADVLRIHAWLERANTHSLRAIIVLQLLLVISIAIAVPTPFTGAVGAVTTLVTIGASLSRRSTASRSRVTRQTV